MIIIHFPYVREPVAFVSRAPGCIKATMLGKSDACYQRVQQCSGCYQLSCSTAHHYDRAYLYINQPLITCPVFGCSQRREATAAAFTLAPLSLSLTLATPREYFTEAMGNSCFAPKYQLVSHIAYTLVYKTYSDGRKNRC